MKLENIIKSVMILGLLAGATEVSAAKVGAALSCQIMHAKNDSKVKTGQKGQSYVLELNFTSCNNTKPSRAYLTEGEERTLCVAPGTEVHMGRRTDVQTGGHEIPNTRMPIGSGLDFTCSGTYDNAACRHTDIPSSYIDADLKLDINDSKRCMSR